MKAITDSITKWVVSYVAVLFAFILMPVFLVTKDVAAFESVINYLFNNEIN